jgi:Aspartyl/Asparaginyl beta-hydroxylase
MGRGDSRKRVGAYKMTAFVLPKEKRGALAPEWARGYALTDLKECATFVKERIGEHVYGAFGLLKERDIATAADDGNLRVEKTHNKIGCVAIRRRLSSGSTQRDFTGRPIQIRRGDWSYSFFVPNDEKSAATVLSETPDRCWAEIFEEDSLSKRTLEKAGFEYAFTKVMAGSEIKGVYCRKITPPTLLDFREEGCLLLVRGGFVSQRLLVEVGRELSTHEEYWAQHYSSYNKRGTWTAFCLRGFDADPTFIIKPAEMSASWKKENPERMSAVCDKTTIYNRFPSVHKILKAIPAEFERVRFMRLASSGGELSRHADITDRNAGVADGHVMRLHIPIVTNSNVRFVSWSSRGARVELNLEHGSLYYLDTRKPHQVINSGGSDRVHLVIDAVSSPKLREFVFG